MGSSIGRSSCSRPVNTSGAVGSGRIDWNRGLTILGPVSISITRTGAAATPWKRRVPSFAYAFGSPRAAGLFAGHNPANEASIRLLAKLGFRYTHDEEQRPCLPV